MKKKIIALLLLSLCLVFQSAYVFANDDKVNQTGNSGDSELSIGFDKGIKKEVIKPTVYEPKTKPTVSRLLPRTNEIIQTLVLLILGLSLLLIIVGLVLFKKVYNNDNYILIEMK